MKNPSNAKGKNHGHQPTNTPHYYQELATTPGDGLQDHILSGTIWVYVPYRKGLASRTPQVTMRAHTNGPLQVGLYNIQLNLEHIQHTTMVCVRQRLKGTRKVWAILLSMVGQLLFSFPELPLFKVLLGNGTVF